MSAEDQVDGLSQAPPLADSVAWEIVALAPNAILLVEADGRIVLANHQAEEMFGYGPDELLGVEVDDLVPAHMRNLHKAHRRAYHGDPHPRPMGSGLELLATRADGSTFPVEIALGPIEATDQTRVVAIVRDVTERVQAERRIKEIQQTLDATQEGVFVFDADSLRVAYVNAGAAAQIGYDPTELADMTALDVNPNYDEEGFRALIQPLLARQLTSRTVVSTHRRKDGSTVDVECVLQCPEVLRDGERRSVVVFSRDITDRLETERQLQAAEQELNLLEDRERIARDLHDTVIQRLFAAGMTLQATAAQTGGEAAQRLGGVIDELDATIRDIRQTIFRLTAHTLDRSSLRRRLLTIVEEEEAMLGFAPVVHFDGALESVDDDRAVQLLAVLREALSNVGRHASATEVTVTVSTGDEVGLEVADDGVGLPADPVRGRGLTNMAQRAEDFGGTFSVEPRSPRGTHLRWSVPLGR